MSKSDALIGADYAPVADRIALFYERFPQGRIITRLAMHNEREIMFRASVYRDERSRWPAATGWASERVGDGDINTVACLENTETSAIGRALANLGFTASKNRPSAEEMLKVARVRPRRVAEPSQQPNDSPGGGHLHSFVPVTGAVLQHRANVALDTLSLLDTARRLGFPPRRSEVLARVLRGNVGDRRLDRLSRDLREWIALHRRKAWPPGQPSRRLRHDSQ